MYNCPACGIEDVAQDTNCRCGADLSLLLQLDSLADLWFNRALGELRDNAPGRALEWLSAACAVRPADAAARRAQARLWAQLGRYGEARDALARSAELEPDAPELVAIVAALNDEEARRDAVSIETASPRENQGERSNPGKQNESKRARIKSRRQPKHAREK